MSTCPVKVALVGCGKAKLARSARARELYTGPLFRAHLTEAEATCSHVYVVSALHGLLPLGDEVEPYNVTLRDMQREERAAWGRQVVDSLARLYPAGVVELQVYAGDVYAEPLRAALVESPREGWTLVEPLQGATQGARLRVLSAARRARAASRQAQPVQHLRVAALRVEQGPGQHLYLFSVDGKRVPEFATVSRVRRQDGALQGYQRPEALAHIQSIRDYVESTGALVPNSVVLAFDSRVTFEPLSEGAQHGHLLIPLVAGESAPGFVVDGQQRLAAVRDAVVASFPLACSCFITDDVARHREQFILVNTTKPLPKGLVHELLPGTHGTLPEALERRRLPATLVERLNLGEGSPLRGMVHTVTNPEGVAKDTSFLKALENSLRDGVLYRYSEAGDVPGMVALLHAWWRAVAQTWPKAWARPPKESRILHGAGVIALSLLLDEVDAHLRIQVGQPPPTVEQFARELALLADECRWTDGVWDFGPGRQRRWNELQNTSKDIELLVQYLAVTYRERSKERPAPKKARKAAAR